MNITSSNLTSAIDTLVNEGVVLKNYFIDNKVLSFDNLRSGYLKAVKYILEEYIGDVKSTQETARKNISMTTAHSNNPIIQYDRIKGDIFSLYDIASSILCLDGMVKGVDSGEMKKYKDLVRFTNFVKREAFDNSPTTISEILYLSINLTDAVLPDSDFEHKLFISVLQYDLTNPTDVEVITESFNVIFKYLYEYENKDAKEYMYIATQIIDYMTYVVASYICRLYRISTYLNTHIGDHIRLTYEESVEEVSDVASKYSFNIDEVTARDINKSDIFREQLWECIRTLDPSKHDMPKINCCNDNKYESPIVGDNEILNMMIAPCTIPYDFGRYTEWAEHIMKLKSVFYNDRKWDPNCVSAADQLINSICNTFKPGLTKQMYVKLEVSLFDLVLHIGDALIRQISYLSDDKISVLQSCRYFTVSAYNDIAECMLILTMFYERFMVAVMDQFRQISLACEKISMTENDILSRMIKLDDIPVMIDRSHESVTSRMMENYGLQLECMRVCENIEYEDISAYDNIMKKMPMFESIGYYSEATGTANVVNKIVALLTAAINAITTFFMKSFKPASDWVIKNREELNAIKFDSDDKMDNVLEYNIDVKAGIINGIDITAMGKALRSFNISEVNKDPDKFIRSLYPSEEVYELFNSQNSKASDIYNNAILFGDPLTGFKEHQGSSISGSELEKTFKRWVADISGTNGTDNAAIVSKMLSDTFNNVKRSIDSIKTQLINDANKPAEKSSTDNTQANSAESDKAVNDASVTIDNKDTGDVGSFNVQSIYNVFNQTLMPIQSNIIHVYRTEYGYIRKIYTALKSVQK